MPTAVVTGANSSLGYEFAKLLIREGYDVCAIISSADNQLSSLGCRIAQVDVSSQDSVDAFTQSFGDKPVDLILNIADSSTSKASSSGLLSLSQTFAASTFGPIVLAQALLPNLLSSTQRRLGFISPPDESNLEDGIGRSSETALNNMARSLATDLKEKGVVVVIMRPGYVNTMDMRKLEGAIDPEEAVHKLWRVFKTKGPEQTGMLWHREGKALPW